MFRIVSIVLVLMTVASCATMVSYEEASETLRNSRSCCDSIAKFKYDQLAGDGAVSFKLDASSDAFDFESGKSYFKAFRLPEKTLPYRIKIASYALGETVKKAHVFYPQVALLDDRFAIVGQSAPGDFWLGKAGFKEAAAQTWGLPVKLEGIIRVDKPNAKYILVFTTRKLMSSTSAYVTRQVVPIIVPGLVTALPGQQEAIQIRHSPFGLLHMEIVRPGEAVCQPGSREADIEPKSAITARLAGRDLHLFVEAVEPGVDATRFDSVIILQGADVMGGTVAIVMKDGCAVGSKFLSALDYIHATQMLALYRSNPALRHSGRLDFATLQSLAKAGDPAAQFHVGLMYAWGRGVAPERSASIEWLQRAARRGFGPAELALGMALAGPGVILDEVKIVGEPPRTDEFTDLVTAYAWLDAASRASERDVKAEASFQLRELASRMSPEELQRAKELARER
jgi:hypothetical protein